MGYKELIAIYGRATAATSLTLWLMAMVFAYAYGGTITIDFNHFGEHNLETALMFIGSAAWLYTGGLTNIEGV